MYIYNIYFDMSTAPEWAIILIPIADSCTVRDKIKLAQEHGQKKSV